MSWMVRNVVNCGPPSRTVDCEYYAALPPHGSTPDTWIPMCVCPAKAVPPKSNPDAVRIVIISDTHELHERMLLPDGDVLIHAGDILFADRFTFRWLSSHRLMQFFKWFNAQSHPCKLVIAGNHDTQIVKLGSVAVKRMAAPAIYAENEVVSLAVPVQGSESPSKKMMHILASPWSVANSHRSPNLSFQQTSPPTQLAQGNDFAIDILLCHQGSCCGELRKFIRAVRPRICHIGGHVHEGHGVTTVEGTPSINGSMMIGGYTKERLLRPIVVDVVL